MTDDLSIRAMTSADIPQIVTLHRAAFGPGRFARSAYRVRENHVLAANSISPMCRVGLMDGKIIAAVNMTDVCIGGTNGAVLLGPLVVAPNCLGRNLGRPMVVAAIDAAREAKRDLILLVGDQPYYGRYGFEVVPARQISFPGPVDPDRILALAITPDAISRFHGDIHPPRTGTD